MLPAAVIPAMRLRIIAFPPTLSIKRLSHVLRSSLMGNPSSTSNNGNPTIRVFAKRLSKSRFCTWLKSSKPTPRQEHDTRRSFPESGDLQYCTDRSRTSHRRWVSRSSPRYPAFPHLV
ncbi:hypothetical protein M0657_008939 [Pyricularia oryzae]|uniref:Uncharacterized protein n=1 Tax=Pyricularia oryzae TaxID=318829 RepID=A0A4P7N0K4_PYROR|nr:hypothetical protein M9X92_009510 [Pyricularia oryzae]KAI7915665.1 hypothetical protein M0657_008939 [Pyricularia oryzae]QBZ55643.1 hypothetical protein PoMZ_00545 [Pyricularia oryzae]